MKTKKVKKLNILFWDDEAEGKKRLLFTEIKMGLTKYGWTPHIMIDKEKAKEFALKNDVDAVILDLKEKGKPVGLEILKYLREKRPFLPIIMFTIYAEVEHIVNAMKGEASYYLIWPIKTYVEIIQAVEVAMEREKTKESIVHERYFASVGELAGGVAHFIKNSLWTIQSRAQILLDQVDEDDDSYELLEVINNRCDDANKVVVNLLNFARGKNQKAEIKELNIVNNVKEVLELLSPDLKYKNIKVEMKIEDGDLKVKGVEFDLKEAFLNLTKNAIEAMPKGGRLSIDISSAENEVITRISDTGKGMNEETLKNLFVPFYTSKENSSGIGLFITQKIIHNHNGTIKPKSKIGEGSTFIITFPKLGNKVKKEEL